MTLPVGKYVLLVGPSVSKMADILSQLEALGLIVIYTAGPAGVLPLTHQTPLLSLVVIDGEIGHEAGTTLVASVKELHPDLPIIWLSRGHQSISIFGDVAPDYLMAHPFDPLELNELSERFLQRGFYPEVVVQALHACIQTVLQDVYHLDVGQATPFLKANRNLLAPLNALLVFCGKGIAGRLIVSATQKHLAKIHRHIVPGHQDISTDDAEDLAGEIGNMILGRLKVFFSRRGVAFELGSPIFIRGDQFKLRYKAGRPSLVFSIEEDRQMLYVEFCTDLFDPNQLSHEVEMETATPGELNFF